MLLTFFKTRLIKLSEQLTHDRSYISYIPLKCPRTITTQDSVSCYTKWI